MSCWRAVCAASPDAGFRVHSAVRPYAGTFARRRTASRAGSPPGCGRRGVGPGDVVALQLPNWMEAAAAFWASAFLGAVMVPIVHFYGRKELGHILAHRQAPGLHHRRASSGGWRTSPTCARTCRSSGWSATCGSTGSARMSTAFDDLLADEPMAGTCSPPTRRPRR